MVDVLKNNTDYGIFLIESDSSDNDDWITDHAGDPAELDLDTYDLGVDYVYISQSTIEKTDDPEVFKETFMTFPDGEGFAWTIGEETETYTFKSRVSSTVRGYLKRFMKLHNRDTAEDFYLVHRTGSTTYETFYNASGTEKKYSKCAGEGLSSSWSKNDPAIYVGIISLILFWD